MQDTEQGSPAQPLNVAKLLQLKRLEKPASDFWAEFDRELQQKQLQALVKPSRWGRVRLALASSRHSLASLAAVGAFAVAAIAAVLSFYAATGANQEMASAEPVVENSGAPMLVIAEADPVVLEVTNDTEAIAAPRRTDPFFVVDALRPDGVNANPDSFRTVAVPETFVGASDDSAYYVVNAFTTGPGHLQSDATLEF